MQKVTSILALTLDIVHLNLWIFHKLRVARKQETERKKGMKKVLCRREKRKWIEEDVTL